MKMKLINNHNNNNKFQQSIHHNERLIKLFKLENKQINNQITRIKSVNQSLIRKQLKSKTIREQVVKINIEISSQLKVIILDQKKMFSTQDVKGIQLQTLISYIIEHDKQEKQHRIKQSESYDILQQDQTKHDYDQQYERNVDKQSISEEKEQLQQNKQEDMKSEFKQQSNDNTQNIMLTMVENNQQQQQQQGNDKNNKTTKKVTFTMKQIKTQPTTSNKFTKAPKTNKPSTLQHQLNMKSLMLSLRNNTIDYVKQQFICNDNKILLQRFLWLMRECITYDKHRQYEIMYELIKLFEEIDIDCNQFIDWNQFLQYIACYGWAGDSLEEGSQSEIQLKQKKPNYITQTWNQINKHRKNTLSKIIEIQKLDMLCLVESRNFTLSFLNTKGEKYTIKYDKKTTDEKINSYMGSSQTQDSISRVTESPQNQQSFSPTKTSTNPNQPSHHPFSLSHIDHKKVLSIDYSQHEKLFGVLQTDRKVYFVQEGQMQKSWGRVEGSGNQIDVMYLPLHRKWLLKRIDQYLDIFTSPKDKNNFSRITFKPHDKQSITAIKEIKQPLSLITSGIDGKIKIWNLMGKQLLIELRPVSEQENLLGYQMKTKGVKGLDSLNVGIQSYFCSWTFTTQIMLWLPSASISKPYIGKFQGHSGIVQSCQFVKPQHCSKQLLISMDNKQVIKLWSIEKMQCLQSIVHQGVGCRVKCLNGGSVFIVYQRVIEFNRLRLNSLMLSSQKQSSMTCVKSDDNNPKHLFQLSTNATTIISNKNNPQADPEFIQLQFCNHNILMLLLLNTQLRIINLRTGRVQHIVQPWLKDQEEFVAMAMKINRRVFILSTLGFVYYVKADGGMIIKRIKVTVGVKGMDQLSDLSNDQAVTVFEENSKLKKLTSTYKPKTNTKKTPHTKAHTPVTKPRKLSSQNPHHHHFIPKYIHYHKQSKTLLIIVQLEQSSMLITYDQSNAYQFEKMKQIQFPLVGLKGMFFFDSIDIMLIVNENSIVMWDWKKLNVMNCIHAEEEYAMEKTTVWPYVKIDDKVQQPFIKHICIFQHKPCTGSQQYQSQPSYLILLMDKYHQLTLYTIDPLSCQIRTKFYLTVNSDLKSTIESFCLISTMNDQIDSKIKNRSGQNSNTSNSSQSGSVYNGNSNNSNKYQQSKLGYNGYYGDGKSNNNLPTKNSNNIGAGGNYNNSNNNNITSTNQHNTLLYLTTNNGLILIYTLNQLLQYIQNQSQQKLHTKKQKRPKPINKQKTTTTPFTSNPILISNDYNSKIYAAHRIRQNKKVAMKKLLSQNDHQYDKIKDVDIDQYLIVQREGIKSSWSDVKLKQLYKDMICGVSQRQDIILFNVNGEVVGEWNVRAMVPKRWSLKYQLLPTVLRRLNQLQSILKHQHQQLSSTTTITINNKRTKLPKSISTTSGLESAKVRFLANRFLEQKDLKQIRQSIQIQHETLKSINSTSKILYMKSSLKQNDQEQNHNVININIKKPKQHTNKQDQLKTSIKYLTFTQNNNNNNQSSLSYKLSAQFINNQLFKFPIKKINQMKSPVIQTKTKSDDPINNIKNNNFFQQKFQQKIQGENKLKINKMFLYKEVEKTLDHSKKLQLNTIENIKIKERYSLNAQAINNAISKQPVDENKQQPTTSHTIPLNTLTSKFPTFQNNQLQVEQQLQKQQIEKNIDFVKRIEDSIQKIQMNYTNGWNKNNKVLSEIGSDKRFDIREEKNRLKQDGAKFQFERKVEFSQTAKETNQNRRGSWKSSKPKRSFSAANHLTLASSAQKFTNSKTRPVSPVKKHLKTLTNFNQNPPTLIKSRSLYGTQFNRQKQFAMSNYKQGLREFDAFYKKFGPQTSKKSDVNKKKIILS